MFSKNAFQAHASQVHQVKEHQPGYLMSAQQLRQQQPQLNTQKVEQPIVQKSN
jgi:hypothetical protein